MSDYGFLDTLNTQQTQRTDASVANGGFDFLDFNTQVIVFRRTLFAILILHLCVQNSDYQNASGVEDFGSSQLSQGNSFLPPQQASGDENDDDGALNAPDAYASQADTLADEFQATFEISIKSLSTTPPSHAKSHI